MHTVSYWIWSIITAACLFWYSTITFVVAYRGILDIRGMLKRLRQGLLDDEKDDACHK